MASNRPLQFSTRTLLGAVAVMALAVGAWVNTVDALGQAFGALIGQHTIYADGYSNRRWNAIRVGMSKDEVASILGKPLIVSDWRDCWLYSNWDPDVIDDYHRREIHFDEGSKVCEKVAELHID